MNSAKKQRKIIKKKKTDMFKKIEAIKGTFDATMDIIKDKNGRHLTEAEDMKKRWQEYTEELHQRSGCQGQPR